ncbi:hypothetical protein, partial [Clostridium perfringens]|uniref:hypothetical protein n=1 Tax=Clostridium perfringens TaxID=1502 RepID=UPI002ACBDC1F
STSYFFYFYVNYISSLQIVWLSSIPNTINTTTILTITAYGLQSDMLKLNPDTSFITCDDANGKAFKIY